MTNHLTPLEVCERLIGKPEVLAEICGLHVKSAFPWRRSSKWREAGDLPSVKIMQRLLAHSAAHNLGLTAEHLIWGAAEGEIAEILAARAQPSPAAAMTAAFTSVRQPNGVAA
jgi:hypothetical protein